LTRLQKLFSGQALHTLLVVLLQGMDSYWEVVQGSVQLLHTVSVMTPQAVEAYISLTQTVQSRHFLLVVEVHAWVLYWVAVQTVQFW